MAKETNENPFRKIPVDEWMETIKKEEDPEKKRVLKLLARRALTVPNMKEYIEKYDNTPEAKKAFKEHTYIIDKEVTTDRDEPFYKTNADGTYCQSVHCAAKYFVEHYKLDLKVEKEKKPKVFDCIADW